MKSMGCVSTRPEFEDNPRSYRVINVDTSGQHLRRGRLEVTDSQLIFHQRGGGVVIRWPLTCLRRYGFDSEIFSFECGRRCATGSGVYGFKCKRAEALFTVLQESINNPPADDIRVAAPATSMPIPNGALPADPTVDEAGYLEPITVVSSRLHYPASRTGTISPGGYVCIHESSQSGEWSSSLPQCCTLGRCGRISTSASANHHYENNEVMEEEVITNQYVNQSVVIAAEHLTHHCCSPIRDGAEANTYINSAVTNLGPRCCSCPDDNTVDINTNYAKLDDLLKQEQSSKLQQHFYVNVKPEPTGDSSPALSRRSTVGSLVSPDSAKVSPQCPSSVQPEEVNYVELDLDTTESGHTVSASVSQPNSLHSLTSSPAKSPDGYARIDFDKTVALSNSANPYPSFNDDSMRKTRHNAVISFATA